MPMVRIWLSARIVLELTIIGYQHDGISVSTMLLSQVVIFLQFWLPLLHLLLLDRLSLVPKRILAT
jgi:hypothetical protein